MAHAIPSRIKQLGGICNTELRSPPNYLFPNYMSGRQYEILLLLSQAMFKPSFQSWRQSLQSFWLLLPIPKASGDPLPLTMSDVLVSWIILKVVLVFGCQHHRDTQWCVTLTDLTCRGVAGGASGPFSAWRSSPALIIPGIESCPSQTPPWADFAMTGETSCTTVTDLAGPVTASLWLFAF